MLYGKRFFLEYQTDSIMALADTTSTFQTQASKQTILASPFFLTRTPGYAALWGLSGGNRMWGSIWRWERWILEPGGFFLSVSVSGSARPKWMLTGANGRREPPAQDGLPILYICHFRNFEHTCSIISCWSFWDDFFSVLPFSLLVLVQSGRTPIKGRRSTCEKKSCRIVKQIPAEDCLKAPNLPPQIQHRVLRWGDRLAAGIAKDGGSRTGRPWGNPGDETCGVSIFFGATKMWKGQVFSIFLGVSELLEFLA